MNSVKALVNEVRLWTLNICCFNDDLLILILLVEHLMTCFIQYLAEPWKL